jgi:hypothetical protein
MFGQRKLCAGDAARGIESEPPWNKWKEGITFPLKTPNNLLHSVDFLPSVLPAHLYAKNPD